jgi:hypothetical protein
MKDYRVSIKSQARDCNSQGDFAFLATKSKSSRPSQALGLVCRQIEISFSVKEGKYKQSVKKEQMFCKL